MKFTERKLSLVRSKSLNHNVHCSKDKFLNRSQMLCRLHIIKLLNVTECSKLAWEGGLHQGELKLHDLALY